MKHFILTILLIGASSVFAQQIAIPRIEQMPDFPQPYVMRDWYRVAQLYDSLVYNENITGAYLPLLSNNDQSINYPEHPSFGLHTYVGTKDPASGEGINVLPSLIGASLCGIDKSNQHGKNWVLMSEEFFGKASGENVYLNNPGGRTGDDWWYETMPNIFFYQLNELYPHTGHFDEQFISIANQWLKAVKAMGGNDSPWQVPEMFYRAWNLQNMEPLDEGVPEPEAAGALAWILYNAYQETGNDSWRVGAEWCMEYLNGLETNPSYELQLVYGTYIAARMNAELGTDYDVEKMLNWNFDIGPLRNWGAINGSWGGLDCDGLIGEQSSGGVGYAFTMNGFQQAAALLPMLRYDDRFAHAMGKWILNLANASRLFYSNYLPAENQDTRNWSIINDTKSVIAYEALKETLNGKAPFATGDAVRGGWAATNLALYGSSHVGMLGGIVKTTNVEGILQIDLLKTDYYNKEAFSSFLYYNPHAMSHNVNIDLSTGSFDIYETTTNQFLAYAQTGMYSLNIPSDQAMLIVIVPAGSAITNSYLKTLADGVIIDYSNGMVADNFPPRIKSLASADSIVVINTDHTIFCAAEDKETAALEYNWTGLKDVWVSDETFVWKAPEAPGYYTISCFVRDTGGLLDSMEMRINVVDRITAPPLIEDLFAENRKLHPESSTIVHCIASDINNDQLQFQWSSNGGSLEGEGSSVNWVAPSTEGDYRISCLVTNDDLLITKDSLLLMVRDSNYTQDGRLVAGFALNGNGEDFSIYQNDAVPYNISWVNDPKDQSGQAAGFNGSNSKITLTNKEYLNFSDGLSVLCWIKPAADVSGEQFVVSHGSWQNRWKMSINNNFLRFTINGSSGITDLDTESKLQPGIWQHVAAIYNGRDLEIYVNDELNSFKPWTGTIKSTSYNLTIGQMLPDDSNYNFKGAMDDLRIYNYGISNQTIEKIWTGEITGIPNLSDENRINIFPNPSNGSLSISMTSLNFSPERIWITGIDGKLKWISTEHAALLENEKLNLSIGHIGEGIYYIYILGNGKVHSEKLVIF
ncbi:MAG: T9SS type A sorting domain-containing protein [Bacteroidales bacterium]|nr:T9SS type A sorting domain-containing protein [Bacteroidales bacterium]MCF8390933.1 T9SS type A sorting domain-containing protein [Bacteroidales bacterium]